MLCLFISYIPFGELISGSAGSLGNFAFTGQEMDWDVNLYHFPARYYEPLWGRFITRDPLSDYWINQINLAYMNTIQQNAASGCACNLATTDEWHDPQSWNGYSYTRNSPINLIDPTGLRKCLALIANVTGGIGIKGIGLSGEFGEITVLNNGKLYTYNYHCYGIGFGLPSLKLGAGAQLHLALIECTDKPEDLAKSNLQFGGWAGAGKGLGFSGSGQWGWPPKIEGISAGIFAGVGIGSGMMKCDVTYKGPLRWKF
jgi:RHS repeat-associated protein